MVALPHDSAWTADRFVGSLAPLRGSDGRGSAPDQRPALGRLKSLGRFLVVGPPGLRLDPLGRVRPQVLRPGRPCPAVLRRRLLKAVLEGPFAAQIIGGRDLKIGLVLRELAQSPEIYSALSRRMLPHARDSAVFARRKIWLGYILLAALCQGWIGHQQTSALVNTVWTLVTVSVIWAVIAFFRKLPDAIRQALDQVKFSTLLVFWLRGDLSPRVLERTEHVAPITGDADPARPLQLRI